MEVVSKGLWLRIQRSFLSGSKGPRTFCDAPASGVQGHSYHTFPPGFADLETSALAWLSLVLIEGPV